MASIYTTQYGRFKGVDRASDPTNIDNSRSPFAVNLIPDTDGFPEKRPGWRTLHTVEAPINGMFYASLKSTQTVLIHGGTRLYKWDRATAPVELRAGLNNARSQGFVFGDKFYLLTGTQYMCFDGETVKDVCELATIPLTLFGRSPAGGGTVYEAANLLQKKRKVGFLSDGTSKVYLLPSQNIERVDEVKVGSNVVNNYTVDLAAGKVTFATAPKKPEDDGGTAGVDHVHITYSYAPEDYTKRILQCTIATTYGYSGNDRVVVSGNSDYRNHDWTSAYNDPTYFPDTGYAVVGSAGTAVMGYAHVGEYLAILKESNNQDGTVFFRTAAMQGDDVIFPTRQSVVGIGMVAKASVASIDDEPLFLSDRGVYAITTNNLTAERTVQNRSWFLNNVLCGEPSLQHAVAVSYRSQYIVAVGGSFYILDGAQGKAYRDKSGSDYVYECFIWNNIPAVCLLSHQDVLYFGTQDGKLCRFNTDIDTLYRYNDDGAPIDAVWSTKADDDGDFSVYKTMPKAGCSVRLKPYTRSGVAVTLRTDRDWGQQVCKSNMDIFRWDDIDFGRIGFSTVNTPQVVPLRTKCSKYQTLQIVVRNNAVNEGFGVLGITKRYAKGRMIG